MRLVVAEAARRGGLPPEAIERFIAFAWIRPADADACLLDEEDVSRCALIWQLQEDLGLNDAAIPVVLRLIDLLHCLQNKVRER